MKSKAGIECAFGFGDCVFNIPFTKAVSDQYNSEVCVATRCQDAYQNLPWIETIFPINNLGEGITKFKELGIPSYQTTPLAHWSRLILCRKKPNMRNFSLIDVPLTLAGEMGIRAFDQRPIFRPTKEELEIGYSIVKPNSIAIESEYYSCQSWANGDDINKIINKHIKTHNIIWLSKGRPPNQNIPDMSTYTRRQLIVAASKCDILYSVGSGFFCAALSEYQPKKIVCLWIDNCYKYIAKLGQTRWHKNIIWLTSRPELLRYLRV